MTDAVSPRGPLLPQSRRRFLGTAAGAAALLAAGRLRAAAPPRLDGVTLNLMIIQPHVVTGNLLAEAFGKATGAKVNVTAVPYDQVQAKATLDVQSGANQFDVIDYWYTTIGALAEDGIVVDVTDRLTRDFDVKDFLPSIYDPYTLYQGKRWGVPYDGDTHILFYNKEIFDRHGARPPATWDEYRATAAAITAAEKANGIFGAALLGFKAPIIIGCSYANRLAGFGGRFLSEDGKPALDSEAGVAAAQALLDAAPAALPTPLETAFEQGLPAFLSGKAAMIEFWTDLGVYAQDPKGSKIVDKWDAVQIPVGGKNTRHQGSLDAGFGFAISAGSKQQDAAWELIRFASSRDFHLKMLTTTGSGIDPIYLSALNSPEYKAFAPKVQAAAAQSLNGALAWPTDPQSPKLMQALSDELALILAGQKQPEQAIRDAQAAWVKLLGG
jgi:multiple sugar transport system substrate-binding protein